MFKYIIFNFYCIMKSLLIDGITYYIFEGSTKYINNIVNKWFENNMEKYISFYDENEKILENYVGSIPSNTPNDYIYSNSIRIFAFKDNNFIGRVGADFIKSSKFEGFGISHFMFIHSMSVSVSMQGKGMCSKLLYVLHSKSNNIRYAILDVDTINIPAIKCYEKNGYTKMNYEHEDAGVIYMVRDAESAQTLSRHKYLKYKNKYLQLKNKSKKIQ